MSVYFIEEGGFYRGQQIKHGIYAPTTRGWLVIKLGDVFEIGDIFWRILSDSKLRSIHYLALPEGVFKIEEPMLTCAEIGGHEIRPMSGMVVASLLKKQNGLQEKVTHAYILSRK